MANPSRRDDLKAVASVFGVNVTTESVCRGHCAPMDFLESWCYDRPSISAVLGPRGGGKSFLSAFATYFTSCVHDNHGTRILGGSQAQSQQIYGALRFLLNTNEARKRLKSVTKETATFRNGSDVSMLAASDRSVRGPHVPTLRLDEIDEIDSDIREAAMGMCMARHGQHASVSMTSTWHKINGPMAELIERGSAGEFPFYTFCAFEVLERCTEERSGAFLEKCPECPLMKWCHTSDNPVPKAKRSNGHYAIDSLIQKVKTVSLRVFEADYMCSGPKADGLWFPQFDLAKHVTDHAEYDPAFDVHLAIDTGVHTGAVIYQVRPDAKGGLHHYTFFADYYSVNDDATATAEINARRLIDLTNERCEGRRERRLTDPAGGARNPMGDTVMKEYERVGLPLKPWIKGSVQDQLSVVESALMPAVGSQRIWIHPRCTHLIKAFQGYRRKKYQGQWTDDPEDPQHPFEDLMDALRGGIVADEKPGARPGKAAPRNPNVQPYKSI